MAVLALSFSTIAEAKRGVSVKPARSTAVVQKKNTQQTQTQRDADFNNTPKQATVNQQQATQQTQGNRLANFATGAMAGYLLSDMLSPNEAQAQTQTTEPMQQLTEQVQQVSTPSIPSFKAIDPQNDPFLIEKSQGYLRYCLNGVQYLISTANTQLPPTLMVDKTNSPVQCMITE